MRQTHSAAPSPARRISSSTLVPPAIAASSAARICAAVRISLGSIATLERHREQVSVVLDLRRKELAFDRNLGVVRPVGGSEAMPVLEHFEPAETAVRMAHGEEQRAVHIDLFD